MALSWSVTAAFPAAADVTRQARSSRGRRPSVPRLAWHIPSPRTVAKLSLDSLTNPHVAFIQELWSSSLQLDHTLLCSGRVAGCKCYIAGP